MPSPHVSHAVLSLCGSFWDKSEGDLAEQQRLRTRMGDGEGTLPVLQGHTQALSWVLQPLAQHGAPSPRRHQRPPL